MPRITTQMTAVMCAYRMWKDRFEPAAIINCGVSSAPEWFVWKWLYPKAVVVGIDPRPKRRWWTDKYIRAAVSHRSSKPRPYCWLCHSGFCRRPQEHSGRMTNVSAVTLREISAELPTPQFVWMDIEGGEVMALRGAAGAYDRMPYINVEVVDWTPGHARSIAVVLRRRGYRHRMTSQWTGDQLWRLRGYRRAIQQ